MEKIEIDIPVGDGPVSQTNRKIQWFAGFGGLAGLSTFLLSILEVLPEGADPIYGVILTAAAGAVAVISNLVLGLNRAKFADAKARIVEAREYNNTPVVPEITPEDIALIEELANPEIEYVSEPLDSKTPPPIDHND
jgi:hypothetical protein